MVVKKGGFDSEKGFLERGGCGCAMADAVEDGAGHLSGRWLGALYLVDEDSTGSAYQGTCSWVLSN